MKFFLDTANLDEIKEACSWGVVAGVTTNPTLVSKEGDIDFHTRVREIAEVVNGPVSAEAVSLEKSKLVEEAKVIAKIHPQVVVKIPLCPDGLGAVKELTALGIKTNVTLVFSANQAILAAALRQPLRRTPRRHRRRRPQARLRRSRHLRRLRNRDQGHSREPAPPRPRPRMRQSRSRLRDSPLQSPQNALQPPAHDQRHRPVQRRLGEIHGGEEITPHRADGKRRPRLP